MVTVVAHITLKEGTEREWDSVMRARMMPAEWVGSYCAR